jgi:phosphate-selective porin OprO and OprP
VDEFAMALDVQFAGENRTPPVRPVQYTFPTDSPLEPHTTSPPLEPIAGSPIEPFGTSDGIADARHGALYQNASPEMLPTPPGNHFLPNVPEGTSPGFPFPGPHAMGSGIPHGLPSASTPSDQVLAAIAQERPEEVEQAYERVLDLFPDRNSRQLIERVREASIATEIGDDTTAEEWVTVKDRTAITWGGRIHADYASWVNDDEFGGQPDYVEFRRLRLFAAGEGYGVYDYQLDIGFAPEFDLGGGFQEELTLMAGSGIEIKDAFVGIRDIPILGYVRIGHMRTPFSLEQLTSSNFLTFLERALPHRLYPGRELGIAAFHHTPNETMTWGYGVFFDELPETEPNIEDDNQGVRAIGRVTWAPWYDVPSDGRYLLHTGVSYAYTRPRLRDNLDVPGTFFRPVRFSARPETHRGDHLIDTGDIDTDQYHVLNPEFALVRGPLSLQSELTWARVDEVDGDTADIYGAYAYLSWFLTGEHRNYDPRQGRFERITPFENFWIVRTPRGIRRGWGAWELGIRWSYLEFPDYGGQQLQDLTVGMNWYWNPHTRVMFNWIHPWARNSPESLLAHAEGDVLSMRLQVDF